MSKYVRAKPAEEQPTDRLTETFVTLKLHNSKSKHTSEVSFHTTDED